MTAAAERAIEETRAWVRRAVVGLNLCPFARAAMVRQRIAYVACRARSPGKLLEVLCAQMRLLALADPRQVETTLVIHPGVLVDFADFNDFLDVADAAIEAQGYLGVLQVASFHPRYQFAGSMPGDLANATNCSPYPTLQLLREASIERAVQQYRQVESISDANIRTLEALGAPGWAELRRQCRRDATR